MVPRGPKLDLRTSCRPIPALMLTLRASPLLCDERLVTCLQDATTIGGAEDVKGHPWKRTRDSAFGLRSCAADILNCLGSLGNLFCGGRGFDRLMVILEAPEVPQRPAETNGGMLGLLSFFLPVRSRAVWARKVILVHGPIMSEAGSGAWIRRFGGAACASHLCRKTDYTVGGQLTQPMYPNYHLSIHRR